jgi:hypothetical protein
MAFGFLLVWKELNFGDVNWPTTWLHTSTIIYLIILLFNHVK